MTQEDSLTVPATGDAGCLFAEFTASDTGVGIAHDMRQGSVDRFRSPPIAQPAVLVGRTSGDAADNPVVIILMSLTGLLTGWRIRASFLWVTLILVTFVPLAIRRYQRAMSQ